jgi:hypothetical protein
VLALWALTSCEEYCNEKFLFSGGVRGFNRCHIVSVAVFGADENRQAMPR